MLERLSNSILIEPQDTQPSQIWLEVIGVFNPAVSMLGNTRYMLVRIAERPAEKRPGWVALPRWSLPGAVVVDWVREEELIPVDVRVVGLKSNGNLRLTSISHLQLFCSTDSRSEKWEHVTSIFPEGPWEEFGIEDPRLTKIDDTYWISYVAVSSSGAATALMSSMDMLSFRRHGIIFPSENKDVVLFPERLGGDYVALHRPNPRSHFSPPQIWLARSPDLIHWGRHQFVLGGHRDWEGDRVGSGTPPLLIDEGWLTLFHGSTPSRVAGNVGCYSAGALLLDRNDPSRIIGRSSEPVMQPTTGYEREGFVPNVVFPTAMLNLGDQLQVFYGAADTCVATTRFTKQSLMDTLKS